MFNSLNTTEPVNFEEIQEPLKNILIDKPDGIFTILYSGFTSTDKQRDLEDFEKGINQKLKELEVLINNTRNNKQNEEHQIKDKEYLTKLLAVYKKQITEQTKNFYLEELKLDESDDIEPKYNGVEYLTLLDNLKGESEPEQVINAFKLLALICATEKAVKESSEWIKTNTFKNKVIKEKKLKYFVNIKNHWNRVKDLEPSKDNNPLYHKDIDKINKDFWKEQLDETIRLWQT